MYDGINLQAGFYSLVILLYLLNISDEYIIYFVLIISLITFLFLNSKSKIFLGDSGSNLLGFIISFFVIYSANKYTLNELSVEKIFILMMLPGLELIRLFFIRISSKRHPFSADRLHIHHLVQKKDGYFKTIILLNFLFITPIVLMFFFSNYLQFIIVGFILTYLYTIKKYE